MSRADEPGAKDSRDEGRLSAGDSQSGVDGGESYEPWEDKRPESDVLMRISAVDGFSVRPSGMLIIVAMSSVGAVGEVTVMLGGRDEC